MRIPAAIDSKGLALGAVFSDLSELTKPRITRLGFYRAERQRPEPTCYATQLSPCRVGIAHVTVRLCQEQRKRKPVNYGRSIN